MTTDNKTLPVFRFARYVNGVRMAEGVTIEKANNLPDAMRTAAKLATIGHGGDVPVLVHEPATLADVQPGGRVRLGDQAELDRLEFQAWARELLPCPFCGNSAEFVPYKDNGLTLKCKSMGCIQRNQRTLRYGIDWLRTSMAEHWNTRALSAQPSPGDQGWPFVESPADFSERMVQALRKFDMLGAVRHVLIENPPVLAARQPVGQEPVGAVFWDNETGEISVNWLNGDLPPGIGTLLYDSPAAQAVDLGLQLDRYDAGLLGDGGGGDVNWWQDYIRAELDRAHEFYQDQADAHG